MGTRFRLYDVHDAVNPNNKVGAGNHHDPHICNGTTNARDLTWGSSVSHVDPPSIAVLNCHLDVARETTRKHQYDAHLTTVDGKTDVSVGSKHHGKGSTGSYVWFHFHPQGAVYLPYTGRICFETSKSLCVDQVVLSKRGRGMLGCG